MSIKSCYSGIHLLCAAAFILAIEHSSGQPSNQVFQDRNKIKSSFGSYFNRGAAQAAQNGDAFSQRIIDRYGANPQTVRAFVQAAIRLEKSRGIPAAVVLAIAIHESGFKSDLFVQSGNPFGIKASSPWNGPCFSKWDDGQMSRFRVYGSAEEAVSDFGNFIQSRPWYSDALSCPPGDYTCVVEGLKKTDGEAGYSSSHDWDEAVLQVIDNLQLQPLAAR